MHGGVRGERVFLWRKAASAGNKAIFEAFSLFKGKVVEEVWNSRRVFRDKKNLCPVLDWAGVALKRKWTGQQNQEEDDRKQRRRLSITPPSSSPFAK